MVIRLATGELLNTHPKEDVMLQNSITAFIGSAISSPDGPNTEPLPHSNILNVIPAPTCEASIDGVDCIAPFTQEYTTSEGITRHLCDFHFRMLLRMVRLWHWRRVKTYADEQQHDEKGKVA